MTCRILIDDGLGDRAPGTFDEWAALSGTPVASSGTTESIRVEIAGTELFVKRHRFPLKIALKAALRNTLLGPSRAARERAMLLLIRRRAGPGFAPQPAALGEKRSLGLLREAFLATYWIEGAEPLSDSPPTDPSSARRLGKFLRKLHDSGISHGSLYDRNVLRRPDGSYCLVDPDRAVARRAGRGATSRNRSRDLACLDESLSALPPRIRLCALKAYAGAENSLREWLDRIRGFRREARRRLDRRRPGARAN